MDQRLRYTLVIAWSDDAYAYIASVPAMPGCAAAGSTYAEAAANAEVVMAEWIATAGGSGKETSSGDAEANRYPLRGTVLAYVDPTAPVAEDDWAGPADPERR